MTMKRYFGIYTLLAAFSLAISIPSVHSHPKDLHQAFPQDAKEAEVRPVTIKLADVDLVDQDGKQVKFASDVIKDRLAVIDLVYTTCPLVCPILSATFANVQNALGDRLGKEVVLISVSVDPATDIPPRLKEYAKKWDAKPAWRFLTGAKGNVDKVLQGLNAYTPNFADHPTMTLVGDGAGGGWTRFYGFATPEQILGKLEELRAARAAKGL